MGLSDEQTQEILDHEYGFLDRLHGLGYDWSGRTSAAYNKGYFETGPDRGMEASIRASSEQWGRTHHGVLW